MVALYNVCVFVFYADIVDLLIVKFDNMRNKLCIISHIDCDYKYNHSKKCVFYMQDVFLCVK